MLWVPQKGTVRVEHNTATVGSANIGTAVTTGGSSSTKGTPAELIASTAFDAYWITILASGYGTTGTACQGAMDILVGAATEEVLIANLLMGHCGSIAGAGNGPKRWDFPLYIPSGTRIAAQSAGARTSTDVRVAVFLHGGNGYPPFRVGTKVTTYGMGTVPNGTSITPGASGGEGSWTQITASTSEDHFAFVPSFQVSGDTGVQLRNYALDIGIDAATEEEIAQSYWFSTDSLEFMGGPHNSFPCFRDVPASTRMVMRVSNSGTNDNAYDAVIHAVS
jgi:hypothetical protein